MLLARIVAAFNALTARMPFAAPSQTGERLTTDVLSGLLNRTGFDLAAAERLDAVSAGLPVAAIVVDIDAFAAVNRASGAAAGDRVITALGSIIAEAITDAHVAGRIGGGAFAVLLPGIDLGAAQLFTEAVRTRFSACDFGSEIPWSLTLSGGVALHRPDERLHALIARADQALYTAKQGGRDRIVTAQDLPAIDSEVRTA